MPRPDPCSGMLNSTHESLKDKRLSARQLVIEPILPEPFFTKFQDITKYDDMWYDDPIEGEEAIVAAQALQHKIEEKAAPIQLWLVKNIAPLLIQALNALVAKRPNNIKSACEFVSDHLLKYNPLKDTYPDLYAPKPKVDEPCGFTIPLEVFDKDGNSLSVDYNPCDCKPKDNPSKEDLAKKAGAPPSAAQMAKKGTIALESIKNAAASDSAQASVLARAKSGSVKK